MPARACEKSPARVAGKRAGGGAAGGSAGASGAGGASMGGSAAGSPSGGTTGTGAGGSAGNLDYKREDFAVLTGAVQIRYQDIDLKADEAEIDLKTKDAIGTLTGQVFNPKSTGWDASLNGVYAYDPAKAKSLIDQAGGGFTMTVFLSVLPHAARSSGTSSTAMGKLIGYSPRVP